MKAAIEDPLPRGFSGPAASVLVTLAGAAIVVDGLLLVGVRETKAGEWNPVVSSLSVSAAGCPSELIEERRRRPSGVRDSHDRLAHDAVGLDRRPVVRSLRA